MKKVVLYLLFALSLASCCSQPQTLSELKSEYITIEDSIRVHYKIMNSQADAKTICFVHGFEHDAAPCGKEMVVQYANLSACHGYLYAEQWP